MGDVEFQTEREALNVLRRLGGHDHRCKIDVNVLVAPFPLAKDERCLPFFIAVAGGNTKSILSRLCFPEDKTEFQRKLFGSVSVDREYYKVHKVTFVVKHHVNRNIPIVNNNYFF